MNPIIVTEQEPLEEKFSTVFNFHPEPIPNYKPTFFSISNIAHYENILTNWYAFFFDAAGEHKFGRLFLEAICSLIGLKQKLPTDFMSGGCKPLREYHTEKGNRIDLLLYDEKHDEEYYFNAIIIENKVYHHLHNDLGDYYNTIAIGNGGHKVGVLLSLHTVANLNTNFISITHKQLINKALELMPQYWLTANDKYLIYLKDLAQNINQLTNQTTMNKNIRFYFNNLTKIHELQQIADESFKFVFDQIKAAAARLGMSSSGGGDTYTYIYSSQVDDIYYTILLHDFFTTGNSISVALELMGSKTIGMLDKFDQACKEALSINQGVDVVSRKRDKNHWLYFAHATYPLSFEDIENLGDFLHDKIQSDFEVIRMKLFEVYQGSI